MDEHQQTHRLPYVDGLKGILAVVVVLFHYFILLCERSVTNIPNLFIPQIVWTQGALAVEFFFLISGFLIARKHRDAIPKRKTGAFLLSRYKIYPSLFFALLLGLAIQLYAFATTGSVAAEMRSTGFGFWSLLRSFSFTQTGWFSTATYPFSPPLWYVCVLMICHAVFEAVARIRPYTVAGYACACILITLLGFYCILHKPNLPFLWYENGKGYAGYFLGTLIYEMLPLFDRKNKRLLTIAIGAGIATAAWVIALKYGMRNTFKSIRIPSLGFTFPVVLVSTLLTPGVQAIFSTKPIQFLGKISMALFATHMPLLFLLKTLAKNFATPLPVSSSLFFISVLAALFLFARKQSGPAF